MLLKLAKINDNKNAVAMSEMHSEIKSIMAIKSRNTQ